MTPFGSADGHSVPTFYVEQLVRLLPRWNVTPGVLLGGVGLTEEAVRDPLGRLPLSTWAALLERARTLTGEPGLGFYLGLQKRISGYGYLGFAAMSASSLREALELVSRFSAAVVTSVGMRLRVEGRVAALVVEEHVDLGSARDIALISLLLGMGQIGRMLTGRDVNGIVAMAIPQPAYFPRFKHLMPGARFDQPASQVVFDATFLDLPLIQADRPALQIMREQCERALDALGNEGDIIERIRRVIWRNGGTGVSSLEQVAEDLAVSPRTLKRMLRARGTSFSDLLDGERRARAKFLLEASRVPLEQIAERLGYSTSSNFGRAFHQWTGMAPGAYRRTRRTAGPPPSPSAQKFDDNALSRDSRHS